MFLMVSLDSENADWLREHMDSGELPNLAALARSGVTLDVDNPLLHGMVYATLYTGQLPRDHGFYFPIQWEASEQRVVDWCRYPFPKTVMERADAAGRRLVVLDPPECNPVQLRNGFAASGLQFRARVLLHSWSTEQTRTARLLEGLGQAPRADEVFGTPSISDLEFLRRALLPAPARLTELSMRALKEDQPDCLWINFCGLHTAAHQFFDLPWISDVQMRRRLEGTRLDLARGYDRLVGSLMEALPAGSRILVMFAKGMGSQDHWADALPKMLQRILGQKEDRQPVSLLRKMVPRTVRRWSGSLMNDQQCMEVLARLSTPRAEWSQTSAFCLPTDFHGYIRFNLEGRERHGIVKARDALAMKEQIAEGLRTFTDADGEPCVETIETPAEMLGMGTHLDRFPDLIVRWRQRKKGKRQSARSSRFGEVARAMKGFGRSGDHSHGALAIMAGGRIPQTDGVMRTEDIPATFLGGLGLQAPDLLGRNFWG